MRPIALFVLIGALVLVACGAVIGSGDLVTETRDVAEFSNIDATSGVDVRLRVDRSASSPVVIVTYDDNLIDKLVTRVRDSTLQIRIDGAVTLAGAGERYVDVVVDDLERIEASGGADVTGEGSVDRLIVKASGGSDVDLASLEAAQVRVDASGGADVTLMVLEVVEGDASGGAEVTILGNPATVDVATSGGARVSSN